MNWKKLRPILRQKFDNFHFYNDLYRSGTRRIKICTRNKEEMLNFLNINYPELNAKLFIPNNEYVLIKESITIHYR
jgi:hypothetical protein